MPPRLPHQRRPLSKERILEAAVRVADRGGAAAITMRKVAQELGVEAMSIYHHLPNKDAILDGVVDLVFAEMDVPHAGPESVSGDWRDDMRARAGSARAVLSKHRWALGLIDSRRNPGPATLRHHNAVLGVLRGAGFSLPMAAHAVSLIDSYVGGFVLQEANLPIQNSEDLHEIAGSILEQEPDEEFPHLTEMIIHHALQPGYNFVSEFDYGLDLILDSLEAERN